MIFSRFHNYNITHTYISPNESSNFVLMLSMDGCTQKNIPYFDNPILHCFSQNKPLCTLMSSSDTFTNFEPTTFFRETEFVYLFLCTVKMQIITFNFFQKKLQIRGFVVSEFVKLCDEFVIRFLYKSKYSNFLYRCFGKVKNI